MSLSNIDTISYNKEEITQKITLLEKEAKNAEKEMDLESMFLLLDEANALRESLGEKKDED